MKLLILNNKNDQNEQLVQKIIELYHVPVFELQKIVEDENGKPRSADVQNQLIYDIIRLNPEWVFVGYPDQSLDFISSSATTIFYMEYATRVVQRRMKFLPFLQRVPKNISEVTAPKQYLYENMKDYIKKYARKIIIIKEYEDFKALITAIEKGMDL